MPDPAITIRPAAPGDAEALAALGARVFAAAYGAVIPPPTLRAYLREHFAPPVFAAYLAAPTPLLVAARGPVIAGYARLAASGPPPCVGGAALELAQLYVDSPWRGRGVGSRLLEAACDAAAGPLWLCAWEQNKDALRFYARHGFAAVGRMNIYVYDIVFEDLVLVRPGAPAAM